MTIFPLNITDDETAFSYKEETGKGPREWGKINPHWRVCGIGKLQSPIDLLNQRVQVLPVLGKLKRDYKPAPAVVKNRGHDICVNKNNHWRYMLYYLTCFRIIISY